MIVLSYSLISETVQRWHDLYINTLKDKNTEKIGPRTLS